MDTQHDRRNRCGNHSVHVGESAMQEAHEESLTKDAKRAAWVKFSLAVAAFVAAIVYGSGPIADAIVVITAALVVAASTHLYQTHKLSRSMTALGKEETDNISRH